MMKEKIAILGLQTFTTHDEAMFYRHVKTEEKPFQVERMHRLGVLLDGQRQSVISDDPGGGFQVHLAQPLLFLLRVRDLPVRRQELVQDIPRRPLCARAINTSRRENRHSDGASQWNGAREGRRGGWMGPRAYLCPGWCRRGRRSRRRPGAPPPWSRRGGDEEARARDGAETGKAARGFEVRGEAEATGRGRRGGMMCHYANCQSRVWFGVKTFS